MSDDVFLDEVRRLLPSHLQGDDVVVTGVRVVDDRPWPRVRADFRLRETPPDWWQGEVAGSAFLAYGEDWRWLSGYERAEDYAAHLAGQIESATMRLSGARPVEQRLSGDQVAERWPWLLERLALLGPVQDHGEGRLTVEYGDRVVTVLVTPEEWARVGEPLDPYADDPQDFNPLFEQNTFLVFYEDRLCWSTRAELPPVMWGAELRRRATAARERGEEWGWFAHPSVDRDTGA